MDVLDLALSLVFWGWGQSAVRVRPVWQAYLGELLIAVGLLIYLANYLSGRSKNAAIAHSW